MKKGGFSLIEVLMVVGIIGVVTAMGLAISNKGIEKAYRNYWYTGYSALENATFDARMNGNGKDFDKYVSHIANLMKAKITTKNAGKTIEAPNGIKYQVIDTNSFFRINMMIPAPQKKKRMNSSAEIVYWPKGYIVNGNTVNEGLMYPALIPPDTSTVDLQKRKDLLPYMINEGVPPDKASKKIYTFNEAYCATHNNTGAQWLDCTTPQTTVTGIPVLVNPRKVY